MSDARTLVPTDRLPVTYNGKLFTIADLDVFPPEVPSGPVDFELDNGHLVPQGPPVFERSTAQTYLMLQLHRYECDRRLGIAYGRVAVVLWRNPDRLVTPAAAFLLNRSQPPRLSPEGYLETVPELVVEVSCRNTSEAYLERKVADYLAAGSQTVAVADTATKSIVVHRKASDPQVFGQDATLELDDVLPGFRCAVAGAFSDEF
jgi:Uma2 family endonuclease